MPPSELTVKPGGVGWRVWFLAALAGAVVAWVVAAGAGEIRGDEEVAIFPTWARPDGAGGWAGTIHGAVYEPEEGPGLRAAALALFRAWFGREWTPEEAETFTARVRLFLVDGERGKVLRVRIAGQEVALGPSGADGHAASAVRLAAADTARESPRPRALPVEVLLPPGDERRFEGTVFLVPATGLSVVSDLDDTVKESQVRDRGELLANTFLRPFRAVPGMADAYRRWEAEGAAFHYVSASPWHLYAPLRRLLEDEGFPAGTMDLRRLAFDPSVFRELLAGSGGVKEPVIRSLLEVFPDRSFVLVGDSGEQDPELYGALAREYPDRVARVFIRDVTGEGASARMAEAFRGVPAGQWAVFRDPGELPVSLRVAAP